MRVLFEIVTDQSQTAAQLDILRGKVKELNAEINKPGQGADKVREFTKELVKTRVEVDRLTKSQKDLNKEFQQDRVPKDSLAGLRLSYQRTIDKVKELSKAQRESEFGARLTKQASDLKGQIDSIEQSLGRFTGQVGNYQKGVIKLGDLVTGGLVTGGIFALVEGFRRLGGKIVDINAQVSDSIADVAKTANVSIDFVNELADRLEQRVTRTSLVDQLGIAKIGGQLGVAKEDLFGFVEAVDVVSVALGDQFGGSVEETTDVIGKLRNVLTDIKTANIGEDITHIGNALNFLEAQGVASAGSIADFSGRIGGVGASLGIASGKILGVSTTLAELSVNAERGSSAFVRILQKVGSAPAAFAKAAGIGAKEFTDLVNKDIFGAVELFLRKLNDKNLSNTQLASVLKELKLNGVGTAEVVTKLGGNLALLDQRVGQATKSLGETSSITQEYEKKNATLGASIEMLSNAFDNLLTNSALGGGIASLVQGVVSLVNDLARASDKLFDFSAAADGTATANDILADSFQKVANEVGRDTIATEKNFNILRDGRATQQQRQSAISELLKIYPSLLTQQQLEAANITQLNGLQEIATNTLRTQITERLKLRAKEAIETEIVQKKLRQVELDATPDRALLGELTAGETLRAAGTIGVGGTLDAKRLRQTLKNQFTLDILQLNQASLEVDNKFAALEVSVEDHLSAIEQDELDTFRQFHEGLSTTGKALDKTTASSEDLAKGIAGVNKQAKDAKKPIDYAADSLEGLRKKVQAAREALEKAGQTNQGKILPPGSTGRVNQRLVDALNAAETELKILEDQVKRAREGKQDPGQPSENDITNAVRELGGGTASSDAIQSSDAAREAITQNNAAIVDDEQFTADQIASINALLNHKKVDLTKKTNERIEAIERLHHQGVLEATEEEIQAEIEAGNKKKKIKELVIEQSIAAAQAVASAIFEIQNNRAEAEKNAELTKLDEVYQKRIEAASGDAAAQEKLQKELEAKKAEIEKNAAQKRKKAAITEAIINTALAVVKSLTGAPFPVNLILAAATAIAGAAQIAVINSQNFAKGGFTGAGKQKDGTGRRVAGIVHENEYVAPTSQIERYPWIFDFLETDRLHAGRAFAAGGFTGDFTPQIAIPRQAGTTVVQVQAQATIGDDQIANLGNILGPMIAGEVAKQIQPALANGIQDSNRRLEREGDLTTQRSV